MSGTIVRIDELDEAIAKEIEAMNLDVIKKCNDAAWKAAGQGVRDLKAKSPVRNDGFKRKYPPGAYARSWTRTRDENAIGVQTVTIRNAKHYQLTHLLEFGHIIAGTGRRSKAFPHIAAVNQSATQQYLSEVEKMKL